MNDHEALTPKQLRTILCLLEARSFDEGCKRARAGKTTVYRWLRQNSFRKELETRRKEMVELALENLGANATKAVQTLVKHLDSKKGTMSIRAAESILELAQRDVKRGQSRYSQTKQNERADEIFSDELIAKLEDAQKKRKLALESPTAIWNPHKE